MQVDTYFGLHLSFWSLIFAAGILGFAIVIGLILRIKAIKVDHAGAKKIADAIRSGAMTFLKEEYSIIAVVVAIVAALLAYFATGLAAICFIIGSILSLTTGFIGMVAATDANVRTTLAAKNSGERAAFMVAFLVVALWALLSLVWDCLAWVL